MHVEPHLTKPAADTVETGPWHKGLTRYHWFVLVVAALGWLFDTMDQQLFNLARRPAMEELLRPAATAPAEPGAPAPKADPDQVNRWAGYSTAIFMTGWAIGGLFFGVLGDKIGRAKTMMLTIIVYSFFTGFSAFSIGPLDFALYRFLTGLGVGGEFAVGVALVAEVMPDRARARALGWVQALSAVGNMIAATINIILGTAPDVHVAGVDGGRAFSDWRIMFLIGALPALLVVFIRSKLKEPERWQKVVVSHDQDAALHAGHATKELGSMTELFTDPRWRRNAIVGMLLGFSGVVAVWGIGFFSFDLTRTVYGPMARAMGETLGKTGADLTSYTNNRLTLWAGIASFVQNAGAFLGIYTFSIVTGYLGRKPTFAISFVLAIISTAFTFFYLGRITGFWDMFWMLPLMGFCQLSLFGGYAIYFPELFPTRLRSTGTSFCYNVGRLVAALGPLTLGLLSGGVFAKYGETDPSLPLRYAGVTMCIALFIGLIALPFAPETKGKPLPD
jgi:MFS family permease